MGLLMLFMKCLKRKKNGDDSTSLDSVRVAASRDLSHSFDEHRMDLHELSKKFNHSHIDTHDPKLSKGLSNTVAAHKLKTDGKNALEPPKTISNFRLLVRQFNNLLWFLMFGAAAMCFLTWVYDPSDPINFWVGFFIVAIVVLMCIMSYFEEKKGIEVVRAFSTLMPTSCNVIRHGHEEVINPEELVVGDIVVVRSGSKVPADIRIISCTNFYLETSSITGEAEPLEFNCEISKPETSIFDSYNIGFNGSFCVDGEGYGIVIRTGPRTVIGQIASLTTGQTEKKCTFEIEIERFVRLITVMALTMATLIFIGGLIVSKGQDVVRLFVTGFLMVVIANVPQGLPATVTTELTIIARRMANKKVFLKKLEKIDSVGATTVIASDKTGTLTKNCMTVVDLWFNNNYISARPENHGRTTRKRRMGTKNATEWYDQPLSDILNVLCICNKARLEHQEKKKMFREDSELDMTVNRLPPAKELTILGTPSEVALLRYAAGMVPVDDIRGSFKTVFEIPFNSVRKWHMVIVRKNSSRHDEDDDHRSDLVEFTMMIKGAPEVIIEKCNAIARDGEELELSQKRIDEFQEAYDNFGDEGCRVIGTAIKKFRAPANTVFSLKTENVPMDGWSFLGMAAIMDPPRETTPAAIAACKEAGIKVYMVTGDHKSTATAIARQIGMIETESKVVAGKNEVQVTKRDTNDWAVITGPELPALSPKQWDNLLLNRYIVFARTTPEHKLMIVTECQKRGEVVTVTGDGVNDSPALKKADVGVAMGIAGSDVAKQAADIILLDDNFASIVAGIEEGRLLFDNLRKTIAYTMTHMWPELVPIMMNFFLGFPLGLTPVQILSIDLITDVPPAISLAYEGPEEDIMLQPPRKVTTHLVTKGLLVYTYLFMSNFINIGGIIAYLYTWWLNGIGPSELAFTSTTYFKHGAANYTMTDGSIIGEERQIFMAAQAASAFHITVVLSQAWHLWMCLTRRVSIFKHGVNNIVAIFAVIIDVLLICIFTFTPGIKFIFGSEPPPKSAWLVSVGVGICMWIFNETRKKLIRDNNPIVKPVKW